MYLNAALGDADRDAIGFSTSNLQLMATEAISGNDFLASFVIIPNCKSLKHS
jgi:hypothetical protein